MLILRLLKIGSRRAVVYSLDPDYELDEIQALLNTAIDTQSSLQLSVLVAGIEKTITVKPLDAEGLPIYDTIEVLDDEL